MRREKLQGSSATSLDKVLLCPSAPGWPEVVVGFELGWVFQWRVPSWQEGSRTIEQLNAPHFCPQSAREAQPCLLWVTAQTCGSRKATISDIFVCFCFRRQSFSVAFETVLELALVNQTGLELRGICLLLPPEW